MSRYLHRDPLAIVINHVVYRQYEARTGVDDDPRTFVTRCAKYLDGVLPDNLSGNYGERWQR